VSTSLQATIDELSRRGHADITVTIDASGSIDPYAQQVIVETAVDVAERHGRLTIQWASAGATISVLQSFQTWFPAGALQYPARQDSKGRTAP
jgi:hypothetical protein